MSSLEDKGLVPPGSVEGPVGRRSSGAAPWEDVAVEVTELVAAALEPLARKAADDIYERMMETAQDYLADNIRFNLSSRLQGAEREAATQRKAVFDLGQINKALLNALLDMMPSNLGTPPDTIPDSDLLPVDMTFGEIRRARAAIAKATGQEGSEAGDELAREGPVSK